LKVKVMTADILLGFLSYALVTAITPGPNNAMLLASGVNFGVSKSVPHMLGICLGFGVMFLGIGLGGGAVFLAFPNLHTIMRAAGVVFLLYLAWNIAKSGPMLDATVAFGRPMTFLGAAAFQWVNPKAWVMAIGAIATFLPPEGDWRAVAALASLYCLASLPCILAWTAFGVFLRRILKEPAPVRRFNITMALLLCFSIVPSLNDLWQAVR
jgi:threonine/homoserine/homoserine lactone efflux protein